MEGLSTPESGTNDTALNMPAQDGATVEQWFRQYRRRLLKAMTIFIGGDANDAEDICQEVFVKCLSKACDGTLNFHGDSNVYTWLYSIAHNVAIDRHRSETRRWCVSLSQNDESTVQKCGIEDSSAPNGLKALLKEEVIANVHRVIEGLNPIDRRLIHLAHIEGRSYEEIAATMEMSASGLKRKLFRCRNRVHEALVEAGLGGDRSHAETRVPMRKKKVRTKNAAPRDGVSLKVE